MMWFLTHFEVLSTLNFLVIEMCETHKFAWPFLTIEESYVITSFNEEVKMTAYHRNNYISVLFKKKKSEYEKYGIKCI